MKKITKCQKNIKLYALTGEMMNKYEKDKLIAAGFSDVLLKPITKCSLIDLIKGKSTRRALSQLNYKV